MGVYVMGVHLMGVSYRRVPHWRASHRLIGVHLTGIHLTGVHLTGVHLIGVYLISVHLMSVSHRRDLTGVQLVGGFGDFDFQKILICRLAVDFTVHPSDVRQSPPLSSLGLLLLLL